jgi:iron complex outermembrane receptor protein
MVALALGCGVFVTPARAQSSEPSTTLEEVVVTGTHISGIAPVGTEAVTLDRVAILNTGQLDLANVVRALPQVTNLGIYREGNTQGGYNATQANAINLRGLGIGGTLTLVDGHRLPSTGTVTTLTDANQLPIAMIDRVELIVDGSSAIYGSDAVGGVVNYVTRKDFEGLEATGRSTFVDGYNQYGGSITGGHAWSQLGGGLGAGNFIVSYDYDWRDRMWSSSRARLSSNLSPFGGNDNRVTGGAVNGGVGPQNGSFATPGIPGNIIVPTVSFFGSGAPYTYYGIPQGNGTGLTFGSLSTTPNLVDSANFTTYIGKSRRHQADLLFNQELTPWATFYFEGLYTKRHTRSEQNQSNGPDVCIPASSPFYIAGIPGTAGQTCKTGPSPTDTTVPGITVQYDFQNAIGSWGTDNPDENITLISGFKFKLPGDWAANLSFTFGDDQTCGICRLNNNSSFGAFQHQVNLGNINPFSSAPLTAAQRASFVGDVLQYSHNVLEDLVIKADGSLFDLPGGTVKAALGFEYTDNSEGLRSGGNISPGEQGDYTVPTHDNEFVWSNITHNHRNVVSAFAETFVPIIADSNALPLVKALDVDGAVRFDHYSDFGDTVNPKLGLTWKILDDLQARGSWGTSFRAPTLTDGDPYVGSFKFLTLFPNSTTQVPCAVPLGPGFCLSNTLILFGAQPGLQPEKSTNWSLGFDYKPHWLEGFAFSATYYNIDYTNRIQGPPLGEFLTSDANFALYSKYAKAIHNPPGCINGDPSTYDPALLPYIDAVGLYTLYLPVAGRECQVQGVVDGRTTNIGTTKQEGLDFNTSYQFDTAIGRLNVEAMASLVLKENAQYAAGSPVIGRLNTIGYPVRWRGRSTLTWMNGPWVASLFMNYVGSYRNTTPLNNTVSTHIASWNTFDTGVAYSFGDDVWEGFKGARLSLNAQNVFDRSPPLVLTNGNASFDAEQANILGRILTVQITKKF